MRYKMTSPWYANSPFIPTVSVKSPGSSAGSITGWSASTTSIGAFMGRRQLYLFLVTVADAREMSDSSHRTLAQRLGMDEPTVLQVLTFFIGHLVLLQTWP
jgi:hypothetical protein